jgi:hypothetical protein
VDADQYDRAVAAAPHLDRPFAAVLGDHRPGCQLLAEQAADSRPAAATLAGLRATGLGRQRLGLLAEAAVRADGGAGPGGGGGRWLVHALPSRRVRVAAAPGPGPSPREGTRLRHERLP